MLTEDQVRQIGSRFKIFQSKIYLITSSQGTLSDAVESGFDDGIASALNFRQRHKVVIGEFEFPTLGQVWLGQRGRGAGVAEYD